MYFYKELWKLEISDAAVKWCPLSIPNAMFDYWNSMEF